MDFFNQPVDLVGEQHRAYTYDSGLEYVIYHPIEVQASLKCGQVAHTVLDSRGVRHIVEPGWLALAIKSVDRT